MYMCSCVRERVGQRERERGREGEREREREWERDRERVGKRQRERIMARQGSSGNNLSESCVDGNTVRTNGKSRI